MAGRAQLGDDQFHGRGAFLARVARRDMDGRAEQLVEALVRAWRVERRAGQHEVDAESGLRAGGRGQPGVVRPAPPGRDEGVGALGERRPDEELEVAQLVATEREGEQVLALDPHVRPAADGRGEPRDPLERRWAVEQGEPRQVGGPGCAGPAPRHRGAFARESCAFARESCTMPPMVRGRYHRRPSPGDAPTQGSARMATRVTRDAWLIGAGPASGHGAGDRDLREHRRVARPVLVDRDHGTRRADPRPPPRRLRDEHLRPRRRGPLHVRADGRGGAVRRGGGRLHLHPGRRDPRRGERARRPSRSSSSCRATARIR